MRHLLNEVRLYLAQILMGLIVNLAPNTNEGDVILAGISDITQKMMQIHKKESE